MTQVVVVEAAGGSSHLPIETVQEIVRLPKGWEPTEPTVQVRGATFAVVDLRQLQGAPTARTRLVLLATGGGTTAIVVDGVVEVTT